MNRSNIKTLVKKVLIKARLLQHRNSKKKSIRKDVEIIPVQHGLELEVYWKVLKIGKGPALILKANGKEVMKFDAFGKDKGHYHVSPHYSFRIYFPEETALDQVERIALELQMNAQKYLGQQEKEKIKKLNIDQDKFAGAIEKARQKMIYFIQTIPELEDLQ